VIANIAPPLLCCTLATNNMLHSTDMWNAHKKLVEVTEITRIESNIQQSAVSY